MSDNYKKDFQIGKPRPQENDPWFYCVIGSNSYYSDLADKYGATNESCRKYMAQRCSTAWDQACDFYSYNNDPNIPDELLAEDLFPLESQELREGDKHVLRTFSQKYCRKVQNPNATGKCWVRTEQFNPLVVNSPELHYTRGDCLTVCDVFDENKKTPEDPIIKKIMNSDKLANITAPHFLSLCKTAESNKVQLDGYLKDICQDLSTMEKNDPNLLDVFSNDVLQSFNDTSNQTPSNPTNSTKSKKKIPFIVVLLLVAVVVAILLYILKRNV